MVKLFLILMGFPLIAMADLCGSGIKKNLTLTQDLDCSHITNTSAITIEKAGVTINGNGFKIIAPNAATVIRVLKNNATIKNIDLSGTGIGRGVEIFNAKNVKVLDSIINERSIGIDVYMDRCGEFKAKRNQIKKSSLIGIRVNAEPCSPKLSIKKNDLSQTNGFALYLQVKKIHMKGLKGNRLDHSKNGLYVAGSDIKLCHMDFSSHDILENPLFISQSKKVHLSEMNLSSSHAGIGLHIYDSQKVFIDHIVAKGHNVGVQVGLEKTDMKNLCIDDSKVSDNIQLGLLITSYDGAKLKLLHVESSSFGNNPQPYMVNNTTIEKVKIKDSDIRL